jgi:hypothetical protein
MCEYGIAQVVAGLGHAIAEAVSPRLPIAVSQVLAQVRSCGICGGAGFL